MQRRQHNRGLSQLERSPYTSPALLGPRTDHNTQQRRATSISIMSFKALLINTLHRSDASGSGSSRRVSWLDYSLVVSAHGPWSVSQMMDLDSHAADRRCSVGVDTFDIGSMNTGSLPLPVSNQRTSSALWEQRDNHSFDHSGSTSKCTTSCG